MGFFTEPPQGSDPVAQEESKPETGDSSAPQEPVSNEGGTESSESAEPVKDAGEGLAVSEEQGNQRESEENTPEENENNNVKSEENSEVPKEETEVNNDGEKKAELQEGDNVPQEESIAQKPGDEQQAEVKPEEKREEPTEEGNKEEQGAVSQEENKPADGESNVQKPSEEQQAEGTAAESENKDIAEKQENESNGEKGDAPDITNTNQEEATEGTITTEDSSQKPSDKDEADGATKPDITPVETDNKDNQIVQATPENEPTDVKHEEVSEEADKPVENQEHIQSDSPPTEQQPAVTTTQIATVPANEVPQTKQDELQEENKKLKQDMFMMKQQEDAYRIKVLSLEQEVGKLRARKIDNRSTGVYLFFMQESRTAVGLNSS